jgi:hypothetical protein
MPPDEHQRPAWAAECLRRLGSQPAWRQAARDKLQAGWQERLEAHRQAHAPGPPPHPVTLNPELGFSLLLKLYRSLRLRRPSQIPRLHLRPRPPPAPGPADYRRRMPLPLRLPLFHAMLSVVFLALLPSHPLSIPTALGLAFALSFYVQFLANWLGYHWKVNN